MGVFMNGGLVLVFILFLKLQYEIEHSVNP